MAVDLVVEDSIATVTMVRPEALNAFNTEQLELMLSTFRSLADDKTVRVVVLTGAGERAFAAGADIKAMAEMSAAEGVAFGRLGHAVTGSIEGLPQPVIAAVNGFALGGGCEVALAADIRYASENAIFAQPEVGLGIPPGWGGSQRLPRLVGPGNASEMILTGRRVGAEEALRIGLVNAVMPLPDLMPHALSVAKEIAANSPRSVREAKRLMRLANKEGMVSGLQTEASTFGRAFESRNQREGMRAFLDKRQAIFEDE